MIMLRSFRSVLCVGLLAALQISASAQVGSGLISPTEARRVGLERAWFTQVELDRSRGRVTYATQYVSTTRALNLFEVVYDGRKERFSEKQLDTFGQEVGVEGAQKLADERVQALKDKGLDPELITRRVPEITLYVATDQGVVHAIDGETGRTRWVVAAGRPDHPNLTPAVNENFVAIVNGSKLYVVDSVTGKAVWERTLKHAPGAGPVLSERMVFVPMISGHVEAYKLYLRKENIRQENEKRETFQPAQYFVSSGRALIQPIATFKGNVIWPTDRGYLYVANGDRMSMKYRLEANKGIVSKAAHLYPNQLFVSSIDGYTYSMKESTGEMLWRFSAGEPISQTPVPMKDRIYVVTDDRSLFCVDASTGKEHWYTPGVRQFIAASDTRLYCIGSTGRMLILDKTGGGRITTLSTEGLDLTLVNTETDRIYVGTKTGTIQCLHETHLDLPLLHTGDGSDIQREREIAKGGVDDGGLKPVEPPPVADPDDPFGGIGRPADPKPDPKPAGDPDDPFGGF